MNPRLLSIRQNFIETGRIENAETLKTLLATLEGPDAMLCYRLLMIHEGASDLNDSETRELLRRKNQRVLENHFSDLRALRSGRLAEPVSLHGRSEAEAAGF